MDQPFDSISAPIILCYCQVLAWSGIK